MVKNLLLCASLLTGIYTTDVCAQNIEKIQTPSPTALQMKGNRAMRHMGNRTKSTMAPAIGKSKIDLKDNEVWWGYFNGKYESNDAFDLLKIGYSGPILYTCGIRLLTQNDYDMGKGKTIEGVKFVFPDLKHIEDVKIWMSTELPVAPDLSDCNICLQDVDKSTLVQALNSTPDNFINEIRFDHPYTIGDKEVYVGYAFRVTQIDDNYDKCPVVLDDFPENIITTKGAFLWRYDTGSKWYEEDTGEVLAMQVLFSCDDFKKNAVNIDKTFNDVAMQKNSSATLPLTLTSIGKQGLKSFKYVTTTNGKVTDEQTVTLDKPIEEMGGKYIYNFPLKSDDNSGVLNTNIKITEVNGNANEGFYEASQGDAIVVKNVPERKVLIEDYTGTWTRGYAWGYVNKLKLRELYGDKAVIASIHNGTSDPMTEENYDFYAYVNDLRALPTTVIDRTQFDVYPYLGTEQGKYFRYGYADDFEKALAELSVATVDVEGKLTDDQTAVDITSKVKFEFDGVKKNYALFYLLTQDGMTDESWVQTNGMGEYTGVGVEKVEPLLEEFIDGPYEMTGLVYDDVVVAAYGITSGVEGSVESNIKSDEVQSNEISLDLSDYPIIQDKTKLYAYAVLIDTNSGKVINANRCKVLAPGESAISGNTADRKAVEVERYTVDGRKMQQPVKGINIIRYSNGKVVKTVVE